ncbi:MAG: amidohydrolase family protein [Bryobacteraceae bacterium]|nr:amidohydrolase family protein [Bryobacteraceae bacterium]
MDTHIHFFDPARFPYHKLAVYAPPPATLDGYAAFVREAGIDHTVIIHPEPYQDDHAYLEYCFANEPSRLFFKGTCLYDPIDPATPGRMEALVRKHPRRIVGLRIHVNRKKGEAPTTAGAIRDRDLRHPQVKPTWKAAADLGLAIQMHIIPLHAPQVGELAAQFRGTPVIIDHLARSGFGTPAEYAEVLELAKLPNVTMKFSGVRYSSSEDYPHRDARALVRQTYDAFGADRMIWGGLGRSVAEYKQARALFDEMFAFAPEADRAKIRGRNAMRLFWT